jgi:hypothetical protein
VRLEGFVLLRGVLTTAAGQLRGEDSNDDDDDDDDDDDNDNDKGDAEGTEQR